MYSEKSLLVTGTGHTIINGSDDGYENNRSKDSLAVTLILGFFVAGGVAMILLLVLHPNTESSEEYGVVLDAGSSHTALYVYKWPGDKRLQGTAVPVDEIYSQEKEPGISSFAHNTNGAGQSLKVLLAKAITKIPSKKRSSTPLYLGATAGMRLVRIINKTISDEIMSSVRKALSETGLDFVSGNAKIITGQEEGCFGWITINYLRKVLQATKKSLPSSGALDLGGASTQITYVPGNDSQSTDHFRLYGKDYALYSKTYLCYGLNEIYRRFLSELAKTSNYSSNVSNPCAHEGYRNTENVKYLWGAPCSCKPSSSSTNHSHFTFYGTSNSSECSRQVKRLFTFNRTCANAKVFSRGNQPPLKGDFLAFSGYYYTALYLNLTSTPTMEEFRSAYETFCANTWDEVSNFVLFSVRKQYVMADRSRICFSAHYVYALLTQGYGFDKNTWKISFKETVDHKSLGWTLGYMINATNLIPREEPESKRLDDKILIPALVVCGIFILVGLFLFLRFTRRKKRCESAYSNQSLS